jgi:hypothetical protein
MAREFSKSEIIRQKCSICGTKNKKFTELVRNDKMCGYKLTCCNCNHTDTFLNDTSDTKTTKGREVCLQVSTCNNRTCEHYRKYSLEYASKLLDKILSGLNSDCVCDSITNCNQCEFYNYCENKKDDSNKENEMVNYYIEKSDIYQLVINGYENNNPKFH